MADRTVSVRLRADVTGFIAAMRAAERAVNRFGDEAERAARRTNVQFELMRGGSDRLERQLRRLMETQRQQSEESRQQSEETRRNSDETRRNTQETDRNEQSRERSRRTTERSNRVLASRTSLITSAVAAATLLGAAETSAAVAVSSFGLLAAPSIVKVVTAQEDLAANWSTLSDLQRGAALEVRGLVNGYKALAGSFEPQAMGAFNSLLSAANTLLPRFADVAGATSVDVQRLIDRIAGFATGPEMDAFLNSASQNAPRALDELGTAATTTGSLALQLATDLTPVGLSFLSVANGALGLVNGLAHASPLFAQFAVTALLLRAPITTLVAGVGSLATRMRVYAAETRGATVATRALGIATALGPALLIAGGAALFLWATRAGQARSASERLADSLQIQHQAVGNNLAGYQRLAGDLMPRLEAANNRLVAAQDKANDRSTTAISLTDKSGGSYKKAAEEAFAYGAKLEQAHTAIRNVNSTSLELSRTYGITTEQAQRLATAAGVDLSKAVDKSGNLTFDAAQKIHSYQIAVENAQNPTRAISLALDDAGNEALQMKDRVNALTSALDASFNPSLAAFQATNQLRQGFRDLAEQLGNAKNGMVGNDAASLKLQQQFASQLGMVRDLATATFNKTRSMDAARNAVAQQLPLLYALAGRNREAKAQVDALAQSLGINTFQVRTNRAAFVANAAVMLGSRAAAERLWAAYQRLTAAQNQGAGSLNVYITRVKDAAAQARIQALRTSGASGAQGTYNAQVRAALPVLYALAGRNASARAQVDALARATGNATGATNTSRGAFLRAASAMGIAREKAERLWKEMQKIKSRNVNMTVNAKGLWTTAHDPGRRIPGLAAGGPVPSLGPESSEAYDSVPALLRVNEHVWTPEEVKAVGGHEAMLRMRALARRGQLQGFRTGGPVNLAGRGSVSGDVGTVMRPVHLGMADLIDKIGDEMGRQWKKYMASGGNALAWARSQVGKPYIWGGVGPAGYDCSGFTSAITNVIQRRNPHQRRHTTHSFGASGGPDGFVRNMHSPFQVGVTDAGVGHMAGTLSGVAVESSGSAGVRVGGGARGANHPMFTRQYGLRMAQGGPVSEEEARLARHALRPGATSREVDLAATLGLIGDPSSAVSPARPRVPAFGDGGWVRGAPGRDRNLIAATRGEFVVAEDPASRFPGLVEALNAGRVGQALITPTIGAAPMRAVGGDGAAQAVHVHLHMANYGVISDRMQAQDWLVGAAKDLEKQGRAPWRKK